MAVDLSSKQYLVIDDFADMRSMLRSMLVSYGVTKIDMAGNGKDAVKQLSKNKYDVVLCDYNLGDGKDGQQVLEEARDKGYIKYSTAFLMLTAENTMEMVMGAVEYLPDDYLSKPFNKDMLRSRLEKTIIKKGELEEIVNLLSNDQYAEAIAMCDRQIAQKPRNIAEIIKVKADILIKSGNYDEAAAIYEGVLAKRDVPWAMVGLGKVRFHTQNYMDAKNIFQKAIDLLNTHIEAYDWLSKTTLALGDRKEAMKILTTATEISPKAILRQMELGDLALKENDIAVATKAFKKAVQIGTNSIYQTPTNYTKLAKIQSNDSGKEALLTLSKLRADFGKDDEACLHAAIAESMVLKRLGRESDAKKAFAEAGNLFGKAQINISKDVSLEMAAACIANDDKDKGVDILRGLVMNHHDDKDLLSQVQDVFRSTGLADEGESVISAAIKEVTDLNNTANKLAGAGKLDEAISCLENALESMPDNSTIIGNIASVLLMYMKEKGKSDTCLYKVRQHLERLRKMDPISESYRKLNANYEKIMAS